MNHGQNVPNVECLIGQKIVGSNVLSVQDWDTRRTDVGRNPRMEDRCWKKPKDGGSHSGAANFVEVLLNDEEALL